MNRMIEERCEHGVAASSCCVCHPEILVRTRRAFQSLTTSEMDAAYEAFKKGAKDEKRKK